MDWHRFDADPNMTFYFDAGPSYISGSGSYPEILHMLENLLKNYFNSQSASFNFLLSVIGVMISIFFFFFFFGFTFG